MDNVKTGALIAARRKELTLTQKELAEQLHISDRTVSKWERGVGFPDISLLEPLADTLGLSVLDLIQGEPQKQTVTEVTLRDVIRSISQHARKTTRQQISKWLAEAFLLVMSAFFLFLIADYSGFFNREISMVIPVGIYSADGILIEESTATMEGERHFRTGDYYGRFAIEAIPETCREHVNASVSFDHLFDGHHELSYSSPGRVWILGPLSRADLYISSDMTAFAFRLEDGRIVATHEYLLPLAMLDHYYAVDLKNTLYLGPA